MKIENSSTVVANVKANADKPVAKSNPSVPDTTTNPAGEARQDSVKASKPTENQAATKARELQLESQRIKQEKREQESQQAVEEKVANAVESIRGFIQENQRELDFDVAQESNRIIISVIDRNTNEVIRQIPPEDAVELADRIKRGDDITKSGLLLDGQA